MLPSFAYLRATTLAEAVRHLDRPDACLHAGGTDLLGCLRDGVLAPATVVSLAALAELKGVQETADGGVRVGAMTTLAELSENPAIRSRYPLLAQAAAAVGSPQLRNQGTVGGNLCQKPRCWYYRGQFQCARKGGDRCFAVGGENQFHCIFGGETCVYVHPSDAAPAMVALEATFRLMGPRGERRVAAGEFFVPPAEDFTRETVVEKGEILADVLLPPLRPGARSAYRKVRTRGAWDFALAGVAAVVEVEHGVVARARIVLSGVAPVPWRVRAAEEVVLGKRLDAATAARAGEAATRGARPLSRNGYKVALVRGVVEETLLSLA